MKFFFKSSALFRFARDKFCYEPRDGAPCRKALKNNYFKEKKITFDESLSSVTDCLQISYPVNTGKEIENLKMEYKVCYAQEENKDKIKSIIAFYFRSAFHQPLLGHQKIFVIFAYAQNRLTGEWIRTSDPDIEAEKIKYRYEEYLSI